ncbi:hypothetical protein quinque_014178 [Culex quinquefasciatus]
MVTDRCDPPYPIRTVRTQVRGLEKAGHQGLGRVQRHGANFLVVVLRRRGLLRKPTGMVEEADSEGTGLRSTGSPVPSESAFLDHPGRLPEQSSPSQHHHQKISTVALHSTEALMAGFLKSTDLESCTVRTGTAGRTIRTTVTPTGLCRPECQ